ncbi:MAG: tyrosine-type recombinase/integrase, partial [Alphaproteobacteria bacterium]
GRVSPWATRWGAFQGMRKIGIKAYTLRKTFASAMVEAGVPVFELAKLMGHKDISTTYKYYTHLQHHTLRDAMSKNPF